MTLEGLVFDAEGGVKVELKLELEVDDDYQSFLALAPAKVTYEGKSIDGYLVYDTGKRIFITALTDFFPEATAYNHAHVLDMAKVYSDLLGKGQVRVNETCYDQDGQVSEVKVHPTYRHYYAELAKRELTELQNREKLDKLK